MAFDSATKQAIISEYATGEGDTGSPEVQTALLTHRITYQIGRASCRERV